MTDRNLEFRRLHDRRLNRLRKPPCLKIAITVHLENASETRIAIRFVLARVKSDERTIAKTLHEVAPEFGKSAVTLSRIPEHPQLK
jgi:hypothetical protein